MGISITNHVELISVKPRQVPQFCSTPSPSITLSRLAYTKSNKSCLIETSEREPAVYYEAPIYNLSAQAVQIQAATPEIIWHADPNGYSWNGISLLKTNLKFGTTTYDSRDDSVYQVYQDGNDSKLRKFVINSNEETIYTIPSGPQVISILLDEQNNKIYALSSDQNRYRFDTNGANLELLSGTGVIAHAIHPTLDLAYYISGNSLITVTKSGTTLATQSLSVIPPGFISGLVVNQNRLYFMITNSGIYYVNLTSGMPSSSQILLTTRKGFELRSYGDYLYYLFDSGNPDPDLRRFNLSSSVDILYYQPGVNKPPVSFNYQIRSNPLSFFQQDNLPYLARIAYINSTIEEISVESNAVTVFSAVTDYNFLSYDLVTDRIYYIDGNDIKAVDVDDNMTIIGQVDFGTSSPTAFHYEWYNGKILIGLGNRLYQFDPVSNNMDLRKTFSSTIVGVDTYIESNGSVYYIVATTGSIYVLRDNTIISQYDFGGDLLSCVKYDFIFHRIYYIYDGFIGYVDVDDNVLIISPVVDLGIVANKLVLDIYSKIVYFSKEDGTANQELYSCGYDGSNVELIKSGIVLLNSDLVIRIIPNLCDSDSVILSYANFPSSPSGWTGNTSPVSVGVLLNQIGISRVIDKSASGSLTLSYRRIGVNNGPIIVSVVDTNGGSISFIDSNPYPGIRSFKFNVDLSQLTTFYFNVKAESTALINDVLICGAESENCLPNFRNPYVKLQFNGIPRNEINIFNSFLRIKYRLTTDRHGRVNNPPYIVIDNAIPVSESRLNTTIPTCTTGYTNTYWKQQGNPDSQNSVLDKQICAAVSYTACLPPNSRHNVIPIASGDELELSYVSGNVSIDRNNWIWAVPGNSNSTNSDVYTINFVANGPNNSKAAEYIVESVELFLLMNRISDTDTPFCSEPYVSLDPATELNVVLGYTDRSGALKEFSHDFAVVDIYEDASDLEDTWDEITALGNGTRGDVARWESFKVDLDTLNGDGSDQCTVADPFSGNITGDILLGDLKFTGVISYLSKCLPSIDIVELQSGSTSGEIQAIILPMASGGSWDISFDYNDVVSSATVPWGTDADGLWAIIGAFSNVGSSNVLVSGSGSTSDPFYIFFVNGLNNLDLPLFEVDGSNLTGLASGFVELTRNFTRSERQQLSNVTDTLSSFILSYGGFSTPVLFFDSSLDEVESALESLPSIGDGNISVKGATLDRSADYAGPWVFDFIGDLADLNVNQISIDNPGYSVVTLWNGGNNNHEIQTIKINGLNGSFTVSITDPNDLFVVFTTGPISIEATAAEVKSAIVSAASTFMSAGDLLVTKLDGDDNYNAIWKCEFVNNLGAINIPLMTLDLSGLSGGNITIYEANKGGGVNEKQQMTVADASGGYYTLTITYDGESETTGSIPFNVSAEELESILKATDILTDTDVHVVRESSSDPSKYRIYTFSFNKRLGNLPLLVPNYLNTLLCSPLPFVPVPDPPYNYPLPDCDGVYIGLCRPVQNDDDVIGDPEPPCCDSADLAGSITTVLQFERDMFDFGVKLNGRKAKVKDYMAAKGLKLSKFTPYLYGSSLREVSTEAFVSSKQIIVVVDNSLTDLNSLGRIYEYISSGSKIMPSRFVR